MADKRLTLSEMSDGLAWIAATAKRLRGEDGRAFVILEPLEVEILDKAAAAMTVLEAYGAGPYVRKQMQARLARENGVRASRRQAPASQAPGQNTYAMHDDDGEVIDR